MAILLAPMVGRIAITLEEPIPLQKKVFKKS